MIYKILSSELTVSINTLGAQLTSVKDKNDTEYIWEADPTIWRDSAPVLFPICGNLKNDTYTYKGKRYTLPPHGFAQYSEFIVEKAEKNSLTLLLLSGEKTLSQYPFCFAFRVCFEALRNSLKITYTVTNKDSKPIYFSVGGHEGYSVPEGIEEYDIIFNCAETLDTYLYKDDVITGETLKITDNSNRLSIKEKYFELDSLIFRNIHSDSCSLIHRNGTRRININFHGCKNLLVWHEINSKFVCIEPWTGINQLASEGTDITAKCDITKLDENDNYSVSKVISFSI